VSYLGSIRDYMSQRDELARQQTEFAALVAERNAIRARLGSDRNPAVVEARARELGYVKLGEMPLRVTGLELRPPTPPAPRHDGGFWDWLPDL
jgi:cell division protein FtsB